MGTVSTSQAGALATLTVQGQAPAGSRRTLLITLQGQLQPTGGIAVSSGRAVYAPATSSATYKGPILAVNGSVVEMELQAGTSSSVRVTLVLEGGADATQVSGELFFGTAVQGES